MYMLPEGKAQSVLNVGDCRVMRQSPPLLKRNNWFSVILDPEPRCRQHFGEILYSAKADLVPNIARSAFAFRSCLGFILIFECPGDGYYNLWMEEHRFFYFYSPSFTHSCHSAFLRN